MSVQKSLVVLFMAFGIVLTNSRGQSRSRSGLDSGWRFKLGEIAGAERREFDDRDWQQVVLPHNWGWEDAQKGKEYYRGPGWYRRELPIQKPDPGRRYFVRFEAAGSLADVYVNGKILGEHRGAFGAFCFEITGFLSQDSRNILAVRVSNALESDVAPLSGDFNIFGGLYRSVELIQTSDVAIALTDHGSFGVAWYQTNITERKARLDVTTQVSNGTTHEAEVALVATILDAAGKPVLSQRQTVRIAANITAPYWLPMELPDPHLWNGRIDPYLYNAVVEIHSKDGILLDRVEQPLGLRFYRVDPDKGFFLNGKPYHLHGVNRHQDRPDKGWAISEADQEEDMKLIKELGCTVIRCAHYQHSDFFYSLCDSAGILVWAELPQVNEINATEQFEETSRNQLLDLIRQNIDHPSILVWSLFNELWPGKPDPHRELQDLNIVAHGEDPTRSTIAATATEQLTQMNKIPDLLGWNIYAGWYPSWGPKETFGEVLDRGRSMSKRGGFCVSEYGAGANTEQHEQNPRQPKTGGQWHPEEWQALVHEAAWAAMKARPFVWGTFIWNMFDFTSNTRNEGGIAGRNDKGLVTYDRKTKKDAFFFYKANWSSEPTLYITSRRFIRRTNATTDVKAYSNAKGVELFVNGVSQGSRKDSSDCIFIWKDVKLSQGDNRIEVIAQIGVQPVMDQCIWIFNPK